MKEFERLFNLFSSEDISYVRRLRLLCSFKLILFVTSKTLEEISLSDDREEINKIVSYGRLVYNPKSMSCFITDFKYLWKALYPDKDEKGRIEDDRMPYVVRHLSAKIDKSKQKSREDRIDYEEYSKIVLSFNDDVRIQCYITMIFDSFTRPQELLYLKIKNLTIYDNYSIGRCLSFK